MKDEQSGGSVDMGEDLTLMNTLLLGTITEGDVACFGYFFAPLLFSPTRLFLYRGAVIQKAFDSEGL